MRLRGFAASPLTAISKLVGVGAITADNLFGLFAYLNISVMLDMLSDSKDRSVTATCCSTVVAVIALVGGEITVVLGLVVAAIGGLTSVGWVSHWRSVASNGLGGALVCCSGGGGMVGCDSVIVLFSFNLPVNPGPDCSSMCNTGFHSFAAAAELSHSSRVQRLTTAFKY